MIKRSQSNSRLYRATVFVSLAYVGMLIMVGGIWLFRIRLIP